MKSGIFYAGSDNPINRRDMSENPRSGASLGGGELAPALKESLRKYENLCSEMEKLAADAACLDRAERGAKLAADFVALREKGQSVGLDINLRSEEIFDAMHRI